MLIDTVKQLRPTTAHFLSREALMHLGSKFRHHFTPLSLTDQDISSLRTRTETATAFWQLRVTFGPGPGSQRGHTRWAYLYWSGPPSADLVPTLAVTRDLVNYNITIIDCMGYLSGSEFESLSRSTLAEIIELLCETITNLTIDALDRNCDTVSILTERLTAEMNSTVSTDAVASREEIAISILQEMPLNKLRRHAC